MLKENKVKTIKMSCLTGEIALKINSSASMFTPKTSVLNPDIVHKIRDNAL